MIRREELSQIRKKLENITILAFFLKVTFCPKGVSEVEDDGETSSAEDTWGDPDTLDDHYERHGKEVGAEDTEDYAEKAHELYENRDKYEVKVDNNGVTRVYDPDTNTFGSYNPDGTTKTYFKPTRGEAYFDDQPGW